MLAAPYYTGVKWTAPHAKIDFESQLLPYSGLARAEKPNPKITILRSRFLQSESKGERRVEEGEIL